MRIKNFLLHFTVLMPTKLILPKLENNSDFSKEIISFLFLIYCLAVEANISKIGSSRYKIGKDSTPLLTFTIFLQSSNSIWVLELVV